MCPFVTVCPLQLFHVTTGRYSSRRTERFEKHCLPLGNYSVKFWNFAEQPILPLIYFNFSLIQTEWTRNSLQIPKKRERNCWILGETGYWGIKIVSLSNADSLAFSNLAFLFYQFLLSFSFSFLFILHYKFAWKRLCYISFNVKLYYYNIKAFPKIIITMLSICPDMHRHYFLLSG